MRKRRIKLHLCPHVMFRTHGKLVSTLGAKCLLVLRHMEGNTSTLMWGEVSFLPSAMGPKHATPTCTVSARTQNMGGFLHKRRFFPVLWTVPPVWLWTC